MMEKQKLYIWDDPESKLRFLDMVMRGQRWEASVVIPEEMRDDPKVGELKQYLRNNGYSVTREKDIYRNDVLNVTHLGNYASLFDHLHHHGLVKGTANSISDLGSGLSRALIRGKQYVKDVASNSARAIGGVYLIGDATVLASGMFNKEKAYLHRNDNLLTSAISELKEPYNQLQLAQGVSTVLQSLIYMQYARDGQEVLLHDLNRHLDKADKDKRNPLDTSTWLAENTTKSVLEQTETFLRKNAITVGALTMIAGQFAYMAGGAMRIAKWQKQIKLFETGEKGHELVESLAKAKQALVKKNKEGVVDGATEHLQALLDRLSSASPTALNNRTLDELALFRKEAELPSKVKLGKAADSTLEKITQKIAKPTEYGNGNLTEEVIDQLAHFKENTGLTLAEKLNKKRNAGIWEIARGGFSTATWAMFMKDPVETENKTNWSQNPLLRFKQEAFENPQRPAAVMSAISSSFGALAGIDKGNPVQMAGELTYLIADALMFITKKHDYGKENASRDDQMIEAATHLLQHAPFAIGANERVEFMMDVARYMIEQNDHDHGTKTENLEERAQHIMQGVLRGLLNQETAFERVTAQAAKLINQLPSDSQDAITNKLSQTLSQLNNIYATKEELKDGINAQRITHHYGEPSPSFSMARIIPDMVSLIYAIPGFQSAENAIAVYELFERTYQTSPQERKQLNDEMKHVAEQAIAAHEKEQTPDAQVHAAQLQSTHLAEHIARQ